MPATWTSKVLSLVSVMVQVEGFGVEVDDDEVESGEVEGEEVEELCDGGGHCGSCGKCDDKCAINTAEMALGWGYA